MIKDTKILRKFENNLLRNEQLSYSEALKIFEALWNEAVTLGVLPSKNPLDGIDVKIKITEILNSCSKNS
jgi:hypothetical protein